MKQRKVEHIPTGLDHVKAFVRCGIEEGTEAYLLPVPVHYDCKSCAAMVREVLTARVPKRPKVPNRHQPPLFDDLLPVKRTKRSKSMS